MHLRSSTRQTTIFHTRPTHLRIKTETDCLQQNQTSHKNFMVRKPLRTCRISEFQNEIFNKNITQTLSVKKSVAQRSIFGQINLHMPKFKKQNISPNDLEHPLKQYINLVKQRGMKRTVRKYKTGINEGSQKIIQRHLTSPPFRLYSSTQQQNTKQNEVLQKIIDEIYKKIDKFKEVGYTEKKINEWIQKYCLHKRKYMTNLLMKSSNKHKFSQTYQDYFYERDPQKVKDKLRYVTKKINGKEKSIDQYDLLEFSNHIEQILIQKNKMKIAQLRDSITEKLDECFIYNRQKNEYQFGKKLYPADILNFVSDLEELELRQGRFDNISGFNRQYFADLGKTDKEIRSKIYDLIKITDNKTAPQKQLIKSPLIKLENSPKTSPSAIQNLEILQVCDVQQF